jgi:hypothetical protein
LTIGLIGPILSISRSTIPLPLFGNYAKRRIHLLDAGHFALDEKNDEIASLILEFLAKHSV